MSLNDISYNRGIAKKDVRNKYANLERGTLQVRRDKLISSFIRRTTFFKPVICMQYDLKIDFIPISPVMKK